MQLSGNSEGYFITEFDNCLWLTTVEKVTVKKDGILIFKFYYGAGIK